MKITANTTEDILFDAILAKNEIARKIRDTNSISYFEKNNVLARLEDIEKVIGEDNQPSVASILNNYDV